MTLEYIKVKDPVSGSDYDQLSYVKRQLRASLGNEVMNCMSWVELHAFVEERGYVIQFEEMIR
jgi:hypothetical protein